MVAPHETKGSEFWVGLDLMLSESRVYAAGNEIKNDKCISRQLPGAGEWMGLIQGTVSLF